MRVPPVFAKKINFSTVKQSFQKATGAVSVSPVKKSENTSDIFIRLAQASLKDPKIESELKAMRLI